jgi:hypothetical protein
MHNTRFEAKSTATFFIIVYRTRYGGYLYFLFLKSDISNHVSMKHYHAANDTSVVRVMIAWCAASKSSTSDYLLKEVTFVTR